MNSELSVLLKRCSTGDREAQETIFETTYPELKRIAKGILSATGHPRHLQPTVLLHEAFLKMPEAGDVDWNGRQHFFAIAARAMRRALIDEVRKLRAKRRVPAEVCDSIEAGTLEAAMTSPETALILNEALTDFEKIDELRSRVVEMHVFGGMTFQEIGTVLGKSAEAAKKDWKLARMWLLHRLNAS